MDQNVLQQGIVKGQKAADRQGVRTLILKGLK